MTTYQFLCILGVQAASAFIINLVLHHVVLKTSEKINKAEAVDEGMKCLLRNSILNLYYECQSKGFANLADRDNFSAMYKAYKDLHGNGVIESVKLDFENLPSHSNHPQRRASDKEVWHESNHK